MTINVFRVPLAAVLAAVTLADVVHDHGHHLSDRVLETKANEATADDTPYTSISNMKAPRGVVNKTVVSSKLRLVFAVGLEGAGHHYIVGALEDMFARNKDLVRINACPVLPPEYVADTMNYSPSNYANARDHALRRMRKVAAKEEKLEAPGTVVTAQETQVSIPGCFKVMSYPNYPGKDKVFQYLDLAVLAQAAEAEGVDLRVVYLQRSAKEIMLADTSHRHFQDHLGNTTEDASPEKRYMDYMRILFTDLGAMHSMLAEISPSFVVCHRFDEIGNRASAANVASFVAPSKEVAKMFTDSLVRKARPRRASTEALLFKDAEYVEARLQNKLDVLESMYNCQRDY